MLGVCLCANIFKIDPDTAIRTPNFRETLGGSSSVCRSHPFLESEYASLFAFDTAESGHPEVGRSARRTKRNHFFPGNFKRSIGSSQIPANLGELVQVRMTSVELGIHIWFLGVAHLTQAWQRSARVPALSIHQNFKYEFRQ